MPRRLRALVWRLRWLIVAACVACAAWIAIGELRPPSAPGVDVLVAARDLPAGTTVTAADLRTVRVHEAPASAVGPDDLGAPLVIGVPEGLPVVRSMLLGPGLAEAAPPGWVVTPVALADPLLAEMLRVGDRVDLYLAAADTGGLLEQAQLVAAGAVVLARETAPAGGSLLGAPTAGTNPVVVVAVPAQDAPDIAGASAFAPFRAVLSAS